MVALLTRSLGQRGAEKARYVHRSPGGATSRSYQPRLMLNALWRVSIVNLGSRFHCRCCPWLLRALVDVQLHDLDLVAHHAGNIALGRPAAGPARSVAGKSGYCDQRFKSCRQCRFTRTVAPGNTVDTDEANALGPLHGRFLTKRINHSDSYSDGQACTNLAQSFFSRLRHAEIGIHHHVAGPREPGRAIVDGYGGSFTAPGFPAVESILAAPE